MIARLFVALVVLWSASPVAAQQFESGRLTSPTHPACPMGERFDIYQGQDLMGEDATRAAAARIDSWRRDGAAVHGVHWRQPGAAAHDPLQLHGIRMRCSRSWPVATWCSSTRPRAPPLRAFDCLPVPAAPARRTPRCRRVMTPWSSWRTRTASCWSASRRTTRPIRSRSIPRPGSCSISPRAPRRTASPASSRGCVPTTRRSVRLSPRTTARRCHPPRRRPLRR